MLQQEIAGRLPADVGEIAREIARDATREGNRRASERTHGSRSLRLMTTPAEKLVDRFGRPVT